MQIESYKEATQCTKEDRGQDDSDNKSQIRVADRRGIGMTQNSEGSQRDSKLNEGHALVKFHHIKRIIKISQSPTRSESFKRKF